MIVRFYFLPCTHIDCFLFDCHITVAANPLQDVLAKTLHTFLVGCRLSAKILNLRDTGSAYLGVSASPVQTFVSIPAVR